MDEWNIIKLFLSHEDHMSLIKSCIEDSDYDILKDLIAYLKYWNCGYKPPRKIRDLARKYIKDKRLGTFEDACKYGNVLLVKIHILSGCNVHIPNNFKAVLYESLHSPTKARSTPDKYSNILKILMRRKVNITNVFNLFSDMEEVLPAAIMVMKYIHDMKFDRSDSKASRLSKCYRFVYHGPRSLFYYYCFTKNRAILKAINTYIPRLGTNM